MERSRDGQHRVFPAIWFCCQCYRNGVIVVQRDALSSFLCEALPSLGEGDAVNLIIVPLAWCDDRLAGRTDYPGYWPRCLRRMDTGKVYTLYEDAEWCDRLLSTARTLASGHHVTPVVPSLILDGEDSSDSEGAGQLLVLEGDDVDRFVEEVKPLSRRIDRADIEALEPLLGGIQRLNVSD